MSLASRAVRLFEDVLSLRRFGKFLAAVVAGLGVGVAFAPNPVTLPAIGPVPSILVGGFLLACGVVGFTSLHSSGTGDDSRDEASVP